MMLDHRFFSKRSTTLTPRTPATTVLREFADAERKSIPRRSIGLPLGEREFVIVMPETTACRGRGAERSAPFDPRRTLASTKGENASSHDLDRAVTLELEGRARLPTCSSARHRASTAAKNDGRNAWWRPRRKAQTVSLIGPNPRPSSLRKAGNHMWTAPWHKSFCGL